MATGTTIEIVHGGGATWRPPRDGEHFRTCSYCGCIHPEDLAPELGPQGQCKTCHLTGWEACFRGQKPPWFADLTDEQRRELVADSADELAAMEARNEPHSYDPGIAYASWADRKYGWPHKFYVENLRNREPERLHVISGHRPPAEGPYAKGGELYHPPQDTPGMRWVRPEDVPEGTVTDGWRDLAEYELVGLGTRPTHHAKFYSEHLADPAIPAEVKEKIHQACGLRFHFTEDGRVSWHALDCTCEGHPEPEVP